MKANIYYTMENSLMLAARLCWREWRSGHWKIIFLAIMLAIALITAVSSASERFMGVLQQQMITAAGGAALIIQRDVPLPNAWRTQAQESGLKIVNEEWVFSTVATAQQMQLVSIQAASFPLVNFPLGSVWVEPRLLGLLNISLGQSINIGAASFKIAGLLDNKNSAGSDFLNLASVIAPRILMHLTDVSKTQIVMPGSRVEYKLLLSGPDAALKKYRAWLQLQLRPSDKLISAQQQSRVADIFQEARNYLQLVILCSLVLAVLAMIIALRYYKEQHRVNIALWRCLGVSCDKIRKILFLQTIVIAGSASLCGAVLGYFLQAAAFKFFLSASAFENLPDASIFPAGMGMLMGMTLLLLLAWPLLMNLPFVSPLALWRAKKASSQTPHKNRLAIIAGMIFLSILLALLLFWQMSNITLGLFFLHAIIVSLGILLLLNMLFIKIAARTIRYTQGAVKKGLDNIIRYPEWSGLLLAGFTLAISMVLLLAIVRENILFGFEKKFPIGSPNYFAFNLASQDLNVLNKMFEAAHVDFKHIYPMVRGRLTLINQKPVFSVVPESARKNNALHRELNLSWMWQEDLPTDNKIVAGHYWHHDAKGKLWVSVEKNLAQQLNLKLGDKLTFQIGDQQISAAITNLRTLEWQSLHPNFYMIFPPGVLDQFPATYITSFYLPRGHDDFLNQLVRAFPNMTLINLQQILIKLQNFMNIIIHLLQYLFLFSVMAGILILLACLQITRERRLAEHQLLRILGASRRFLTQSVWVEFTAMGVWAGLMAGLLALVLANLVTHKLFFNLMGNMAWQDYFIWPFFGMMGGFLCITLPAIAILRKIQ